MSVQVKRQRLIIEAFDCNSPIDDVKFVYDLVEEISKAIDMRIVVPPIIVKIPVANADDSIATNKDYGISGTVVWLESGAQIHTWPEYNFMTLDIFSCKKFDNGAVFDLVKSIVKPSNMNVFSNLSMSQQHYIRNALMCCKFMISKLRKTCNDESVEYLNALEEYLKTINMAINNSEDLLDD